MSTTRIFIVEDDQFLGSVIKLTLEKLNNVDVTYFAEPEECLKNLHRNPHIVSIDYLLPGMNGIELMEKIKNYNQDIFCIMVSGQEKLDVVIDTYKRGAIDYIIKNENAIVNLENSVKNLCKVVDLKQENEHLKDIIVDRNKYHGIGYRSERHRERARCQSYSLQLSPCAEAVHYCKHGCYSTRLDRK
jgi:DNA-binding NtrC family response regulator